MSWFQQNAPQQTAQGGSLMERIKTAMPAGDNRAMAQPQAATQQAGGDLTSWWNPADPQGSIAKLTQGKEANSQTLTSLAPYLQAVGGRLENPNAAGITSKIYLPGQANAIRIGNMFDAPGSQMSWGYVPQPGANDAGAGGGAAGAGWQAGMDPSYGFRVGEGQKALERSAAAKGTLLTGGTGKALARYGQDMASQEYGNIFGRNLSLASLGQNSAAGVGNVGTSYANQAGNTMENIGNAKAAGNVASGNIGSGMTTNLTNIGMDAWTQWRNRIKNPAAVGTAVPSYPGSADLTGM